MLLLSACTTTPSLPAVRFPIANGTHTFLPAEHQRILIWGDPQLNHIVEEWLRSHHYSHILMPHPTLPITPQITRSAEHQTALILAAELHADFVLVVNHEELKDGALIEPHCRVRSNIIVDVRGLSVEHKESVLHGNAYYPQCVEANEKTFRNLTCQALATVWGFRPSGQLEIPSHLACTAGQRTSIPSH